MASAVGDGWETAPAAAAVDSPVGGGWDDDDDPQGTAPAPATPPQPQPHSRTHSADPHAPHTANWHHPSAPTHGSDYHTSDRKRGRPSAQQQHTSPPRYRGHHSLAGGPGGGSAAASNPSRSGPGRSGAATSHGWQGHPHPAANGRSDAQHPNSQNGRDSWDNAPRQNPSGGNTGWHDNPRRHTDDMRNPISGHKRSHNDDPWTPAHRPQPEYRDTHRELGYRADPGQRTMWYADDPRPPTAHQQRVDEYEPDYLSTVFGSLQGRDVELRLRSQCEAVHPKEHSNIHFNLNFTGFPKEFPDPLRWRLLRLKPEVLERLSNRTFSILARYRPNSAVKTAINVFLDEQRFDGDVNSKLEIIVREMCSRSCS